jgi:serine/threonine protein kinase/Tol biopolymer transport system component
MSFGPGTRLGPYEIAALIGEGGMGKVWRAHHAALNRDDALKVLPDAFASDPDRLARFRREAQVLASLNHPNIAHVYGLEQADGVPALVMELVEGETLADRIARGPIQLDEALPISMQIAGALEAAHEQGIIHRDLKPANVKLRPDGTVKVLDFGLAKALEPLAETGRDATLSPTITSPVMMTGVGVLLGTAAYMSPEQAKGKPADKRSDIWAFGCVLYEMLTGKRAFGGEDVSETLASILRDQPDWHVLPAGLPSAVRDLLQRCLTRDRNRRIDAGVVRFLLDYESSPATAPKRSEPALRFLAWIGISLALIGTSAAIAWRLKPDPTIPPVTRFTAQIASAAPLITGSPYVDLTMAPDGSAIAYSVAPAGQQAQLMLRRMDRADATVIRGAGSAVAPFFSADGRWIGFVGDGELRKVPVTGGPPLLICGVPTQLFGAAWGASDVIVFSNPRPGGINGLQRVSAAGGEPTILTRPDAAKGEVWHILPEFLPNGRVVLFTVEFTRQSNTMIDAVDLATGQRKTLIRGGTQARFVEPGFLVYQSGGSLMGVRFDPEAVAVIGEPLPILDGVLTKNASRATEFAVSRNGSLAYVGAANGAITYPDRTLTWVTRDGKEQPIEAPAHPYVYARLSPDQTRIAVDVRDQNQDIWIWDFSRRTLTRLTTTPVLETSPVWTPDGTKIVLGSQRPGPSNLFMQSADGTGDLKQLASASINQVPTSISPDGRQVLFWQNGVMGLDLMLLHLETGRTETLLATRFDESNGVISPDGRWLAYQSNESGDIQVFVRPFPSVSSGRVQISTSGGFRPLWAHSGRELFYFNAAGELMATHVDTTGAFKAAASVKVLDAKYFAGTSGAGARTYDVSRDDQRFLMIKDPLTPEGRPTPPNIEVVVNWRNDLTARLGSQ